MVHTEVIRTVNVQLRLNTFISMLFDVDFVDSKDFVSDDAYEGGAVHVEVRGEAVVFGVEDMVVL
jgi:hypothetical protein